MANRAWPFAETAQTYLDRFRADGGLPPADQWKRIGDYALYTVEKAGHERLGLIRWGADAPRDLFGEHEHPEGEMTWVVNVGGGWADEAGTYTQEDGCVELPPGSCHRPRSLGRETVLMTWWPAQIRPV